nr:MAG TPA: hypothetical protein [Caudoviricetes sp.]
MTRFIQINGILCHKYNSKETIFKSAVRGRQSSSTVDLLLL